MKMRVVDQLHISSISPHAMGKGTEFEVSDAQGEELLKKGLATRVEATTETNVAEKAAEDPANRADTAPLNKAERRAPRNKSTAKKAARK